MCKAQSRYKLDQSHLSCVTFTYDVSAQNRSQTGILQDDHVCRVRLSLVRLFQSHGKMSRIDVTDSRHRHYPRSTPWAWLITSVKEVMFSSELVSYFVCLSVSGIMQKLLNRVDGVAWWVERWSRPANFPYPAPDC